MIQIAPSLVSAPLAYLAETVKGLEKAGADILHFDLEDGNFVPVMSLGTQIIRAARPLSSLPFDVHLMINNPEWILPTLAEIGVEMVSVHIEACPYPRRTLGLIHRHGIRAGLAFNPKTPLPDLRPYLPFLSFVLILTTEPESETCTYLPSVLDKVIQGRQQPGLEDVLWEVDGGFTAENIEDALRVNADIVVSGRGVFRDNQFASNIQKMKSIKVNQ
ncbi:MAG: ribulose-phosphate 3-epimerase [Chloroflexota bacterium]|nr:ribulose-phosphate 3-epimerase [Chloroflexota bacterium]